MRPRTRRRHVPLLDRGLRRPGNNHSSRTRPLGKILDQIIGDGLDLIFRDRHIEVEHHAHDRAPALGRVARAHAIDVMAAAADLHERFLSGAVGEIRLRLLRMRRRRAHERRCEQEHEIGSVRHGFSPHSSL